MENELIQHTPEPWDYDDEYNHAHIAGGEIVDMEPTGRYEVFADGGEVIICVASKPNARRICAAVNATASLTTEQLEFAAAENLKLDFQNRMKNLESEVEYLRSQNVQMRSALQGVCENIARATPTPAQPEPVNAQMLEALKRLVHHHAEEENSSPQYLDFALFSARAAIAAAEAHQPQPFQVIANLTRKLGDVIKALRFARSVMVENGIIETSERLAIEKIDEALKPYDLSQQPTYGTGPMIQERPRPEEPDGPDPCDLARDFNDALQDGDQPTPYDEAKYRPLPTPAPTPKNHPFTITPPATMFQTKIENRRLYYRLSENHGWILEAEIPYKSDAEAAKRADFIHRMVKIDGQIVYAWHPTKKIVYLYHTAMFRLGFADRNAQAKGLLSCSEICRRDATALDNLDFLTGSRAKWYEYDNINTLIQDEAQFADQDAIKAKYFDYKHQYPDSRRGTIRP